MKKYLFCALLLVNTFFLFAENYQEEFIKNLKVGSTYAVKNPYSKAVDQLFLGKNEKGSIDFGGAIRVFKSYEKITAFMIIKKIEDEYKVVKVDIPDIEKISEKSKREKILVVIKDFQDKVLKKGSEKIDEVDAVAKATRYHKKMYATFNLLAKKIVFEMSNNPDWTYKKLNN